MKQYVIIRQNIMDELISSNMGDVEKTSLKLLTVISLNPVQFFAEQPECPYAAGVFKVQNDFDTLLCLASQWDTSD